MKKTILSLGIALGMILVATPTAFAGHDGAPVTVQRTYEFAPTYAALNCVTGSETLGTSCDPTGQTQDGSIDTGGAIFTTDDVPDGVDAVQASVVDDISGAGVVALYICTDEDGNNICGETDKGEVQSIHCGSSPVIDIPAAPNWDAVVVFVSYWGWQVEHCDPTAGYSTMGGVLNPSGGIFATFK